MKVLKDITIIFSLVSLAVLCIYLLDFNTREFSKKDRDYIKYERMKNERNNNKENGP